MKRKILIVCMIVLGLLSLTGCQSGGNETLPVSDEEYMDYAGRQFAGEDPWGGILTVTVRSIVDGKMEWTFTDVFDDSTLYQLAEGTPVKDGKADFDIEGKDVENDSITFNYQGEMELKDGKVLMTLTSGCVMTASSEGGSSSRNAEALAGSGLSNQVLLVEADSLDEYTVQSGDSIHSIAEAYGISTRELAIMNQTVIIETAQAYGYEFDDVIEYAKYLFPGEVLKVPAK